MAEFKVERLSYLWKGEWQPGQEYKRDDVISLNGKSYVCLIGHTADSAFSNDLNAVVPGTVPPQINPRWVLMTSGITFRETWETATEYNLRELVYYKGSVYICVQAHISSSFPSDRENWEFFALHIDYLGEWESSTDYSDGSIVKYNGIVYKCIEAHQSDSALELDIEKWEEFYVGIEYRGDWEPNIEFRKNDLVKFGASVYRCIETHTSQETAQEFDPETGQQVTVIGFDSERFQIEFPGTQYESEWDPTEKYQRGDVVRHGGTLYVAIRENIDSDPFREPTDSTIDWEQFAYFYRFRGEHQLGVEYRTGDVVQRGGQLFVAVKDIDRNDGAGSLQDYLDPDWWELLIPGSAFSRNWIEGRNYSVGEIVYFLGTAFRCNFEHVSSARNFPGDNGNPEDFWDTFIQGQPGGLRLKGDLLTFGLSRPLTDDGSTVGDVRVPIGDEEQFLSVSEDLEVFWRHRDQDSDQIFVGRNGIDDPDFDKNRGLVKEKPFRTVKFAAQYVEDNFEPGTLVSIKVATGTFEEVAPIIVPAGCAVIGDELRSTTVVANRPLEEYQNDFQFVQNYISYLNTFILDVLQNNPVTPTAGNDITQNLNTARTDVNGVNLILNQIDQFVNYVEFRISDGSIDPVLSGSNEPNPNQDRVRAGRAIWENRKFIAAELWAFTQSQNPNENFDRTRVVNDVISLIRGIRKDLETAGNYHTLLAAERYVNSVNGSQTGDLFRLRDTTGVRLMTVTGLEGETTPITEERRYPVVTGGAFVALDPGWGPQDNRTWIINRSPYIQNVTTIGKGCVGKRVDGRLHNGGNRSMVSNDFTQVLSDGIGAWVSHGGRTELVSVFTYFNAVGYLAEQGGIIRATNGNNSYGRFGTVASGVDPEEVPATAQVFNRNNQAQVDEAISGGAADEIFAFEYSHAGENYSEAQATVIGAGDFVETEFRDFRDGALFDGRLTAIDGSGAPGGSSYLVQQGFAQVTADSTSTIILSATDNVQLDTDYIGQRIIIIAGSGAGQFGFISAYSPSSKTATIRRESDGELGWDHIIAGTPILSDLDSTAQYRIEPRVTAAHPGFSNTGENLPAGRTVVASTYGETTEFFNNIELGQGTGTVNNVIFQPAIVNVVKRGRVYDVGLVNGGSGYSAGDSFVVLGSQLGGTTPENDLFIDVISATDDSTNSILEISSEGRGKKGRIVAIAEPNFVIYSDNGSSWQENTVSFVGDYKTVIAGNNRFVAVAENENRISLSFNGISWQTRSTPDTQTWSDGAFGAGKFVIIADDSNNVVYSSDGETWSLTDIPDDTGEFQDSTVSSYTHVAFGKGKFVAVSVSDKATATSTDGITWTRHVNALPDPEDHTDDFVGLAFGDNKWMLLNRNGVVYYSFDGITWIQGETAPNNELNPIHYVKFKYSQGVFLAISQDEFGGPTNLVATTESGLLWRSENLNFSQTWTDFASATFDTLPEWYIFADSVTLNGVARVKTGKQAKLRVSLFQRSIDIVKILDPGSGYSEQNLPQITVIDSQATVDAQFEERIGSGVLAQPDFINRGSGYVARTSRVTITGNGFADIIPEDNTVTLSGIQIVPRVGAQLRFSGVFDEIDTESLKLFNASRVFDLGDDGTRQGTRLVRFDISPRLRTEYNLAHNTQVLIRERYSQARITGHDFLDIGTGNEPQTDYPAIYAEGNFFVAAPENEVRELNGGRVFYVSTDQDGNFRGGELFAVNQATGVITISAEFFDLGGLSELSLGGIRLGGSGAVVREFSADPTFTQDSNNVVSTQRAISRFLESRLSVGGENVETNLLTAGRVRLGGPDNVIEPITRAPVNFSGTFIHQGQDALGNPSGVGGTMISQQLFLRTFNDSIQ